MVLIVRGLHYIERFNRTYRNEVLDLYLFETLDQVLEITHRWMINYNEHRPHDSVGDLTPIECAETEVLVLDRPLDRGPYDGSEFVNRDVAAVVKAHNLIDIKTRPRHPESNGIVERFDGTVRDESDNDGANYRSSANSFVTTTTSGSMRLLAT